MSSTWHWHLRYSTGSMDTLTLMVLLFLVAVIVVLLVHESEVWRDRLSRDWTKRQRGKSVAVASPDYASMV
jgi:hypothetical protein